jgi:hypothetical protein
MGSEQNFGCALLCAGKIIVLNFDLTPFFATTIQPAQGNGNQAFSAIAF